MKAFGFHSFGFAKWVSGVLKIISESGIFLKFLKTQNKDSEESLF